MVNFKSPCSLITILTILLLRAEAFNFCANYILTTPFYPSSCRCFYDQGDPNEHMYSSLGTDMATAVSCSSIYLNQFSWGLYASISKCTGASQFGLGVWANFESILNGQVILIGPLVNREHYFSSLGSSEGVLTFDYYKSNPVSVTNAFTIDIPMNQWTFLVFHWNGPTFKYYVPGQDVILKSSPNSGIPFSTPSSGEFVFGQMIKAHVYQILVFNSVSNTPNNNIITLADSSANTYVATGICTVSCDSQICHPTQQCLASTTECTNCNTNACTACSTTHLPSSFCNFLVCSSNCAKCSTATICTQCNAGYFLYDNAGATTCISCADSCTNCTPGPACFICADSIATDGTTCRVDSVGFQLSFSSKNIELDFAHPLSSNLALKSIAAKSNQGATIATTNWQLNPCNAGSSSCIIVTDNVSESQLPLEVDFNFSKI